MSIAGTSLHNSGSSTISCASFAEQLAEFNELTKEDLDTKKLMFLSKLCPFHVHFKLKPTHRVIVSKLSWEISATE